VERAQRTHIEEFYKVTEVNLEIQELNRALLEWEKVYNTTRPHQALGYLTPLEFLEQYQRKRREVMYH
jgi:transposase InsO family protein